MTEPLDQANIPVSALNYPLSTSAKQSDGLEYFITKDPLVNDDETCAHMAFTVHSPFELPNSMTDSRDYATFDYGQSLEVIITPTVVYSDEKLRSTPPSIRKCYFEGERKLKFFKTYTLRNCEHECLVDYHLSKLNCTSFFHIRDKSCRICGLNDMKLVTMHSQREYFLEGEHDCMCLEECNSVKYGIDIHSQSLSAKHNES